MMGARRRKIASIVMPVVLLITSFVLLNPILPRAVASQSHSSILIVGNAEFTPANGVTVGTGTASDPYVIQGWNINVCWQCPYYGIEVANTTDYCTASNRYSPEECDKRQDRQLSRSGRECLMLWRDYCRLVKEYSCQREQCGGGNL